MKRILNVSLFLSILACLFYGLDGIFNLDLIAIFCNRRNCP